MKKIILTGLCIATVAACIFLYFHDNKYINHRASAVNGILLLEDIGEAQPWSCNLVDGWEFYRQKLLSPSDFKSNPPIPDEYIYIGQYGGFEAAGEMSGSHGSGSYRINIMLPREPAVYMLELPEIYSAYRVYINGEDMGEMGNVIPEEYRPQTGIRKLTFEAAGRLEILVAVTDFASFYSGMVYPPILGTPEKVMEISNLRLLFRGFLGIFSLVLGGLAILIGIGDRDNRISIWYGGLCFCFIGYTCYPILHTFWQGFHLLYTIERVSFCAMLVFVLLVQNKICGSAAGRLSKAVIWFGVFVCLMSVLVSLFLPSGNLYLMGGYSYLIMGFKWMTAIYLTITTAISVFSKKHWDNQEATLMLGAMVVFDSALIMDRLLPLYEPIITGWFPELASFVLVLTIGVIIAREVALQYKRNVVLQERNHTMEKLAQMHEAHYPVLKQKIYDARIARHDVRHHINMMDRFIKERQYDKLEQYLREYKTVAVSWEPIVYTEHEVINVLLCHYESAAKEKGIACTFDVKLISPVRISDIDICALFSNLLENGIEACQRAEDKQPFIRLSIRQHDSVIQIEMINSTDERQIDSERESREARFWSSKAEGRKGYGLESISAIAEKYDGAVEFEYNREEKIFHSIIWMQYLPSKGFPPSGDFPL